jgi:carbon monoxide dehydrogenase subunit G
MDVSGHYTLYVPQERVWAALLDPAVLHRVVPGCEVLEQAEDGNYRGRVRVGVAAVQGTYDGTLRLVDPRPPEDCRIVADGKGVRGIIHGEGTIHLAAADESTTVVTYTGKAQLGGPIASVGTRVVGAAATMLIRSFFAALADDLGAPGSAKGPAEGAGVAGGRAAVTGPARTAMAGSTGEASGAGLADAGAPDAETSPRQVVGSALACGAASWSPVMHLVRRLGLSDGSGESERRWSRRIVAAGVVAATAVVALTVAVVVRLTHR